MPQIPSFTETFVPTDRPDYANVNPERFGKDSDALQRVGGELQEFGNKLVEARTVARDSDAVANAKLEDTIALDKSVNDIKMKWDPNSGTSPSSELRDSMMKTMEERAKTLPSQRAQQAYRERMMGTMESRFQDAQSYENHAKAAVQIQNIETRTDVASKDIYDMPTQTVALTHLADLRADLESKAGTSISAAAVPAAYNKLGQKIVNSYFHGLADQTVDMSPQARMEAIEAARQQIKNPPEGMREFLDSDTARNLSAQLDHAEKIGEQNDSYKEQLQEKAKKQALQKVEDQVLSQIYDDKMSIKGILKTQLTPEKKQHLIGVLNARLREPERPDPGVMRDIVSRIHADPDDPDKIASKEEVTQLYINGNMTLSQRKIADQEIDSLSSIGGQVEGGMKGQLLKQAKGQLLNDRYGLPDEHGSENLAKFNSYMLTELENAKKNGQSTRELLDANSPKYLGKAIANFQSTPQQTMQKQLEVAKMRPPGADPKAPTAVPQPKGTVMMMDSSGKRFFVPEANAAKALARGFKDISGRKPQSMGEPIVEDSPDNLDKQIRAVMSNDKMSDEDKVSELEYIRDAVDNNQPQDDGSGMSGKDYVRLGTKVSNHIDRLEPVTIGKGKGKGRSPQSVGSEAEDDSPQGVESRIEAALSDKNFSDEDRVSELEGIREAIDLNQPVEDGTGWKQDDYDRLSDLVTSHIERLDDEAPHIKEKAPKTKATKVGELRSHKASKAELKAMKKNKPDWGEKR